MQTFTIASDLSASAEVVWGHISTMAGVNEELAPLRMTFPPSVVGLRVEDARPGQVLFQSWVLLFGFIPIDRHGLCLTEIVPGEGFHEDSATWLQRRWEHDRRITARAGGVTVTDRLRFEPRVQFMAPVIARIVRAVFERRHRRLRERFGVAG